MNGGRRTRKLSFRTDEKGNLNAEAARLWNANRDCARGSGADLAADRIVSEGAPSVLGSCSSAGGGLVAIRRPPAAGLVRVWDAVNPLDRFASRGIQTKTAPELNPGPF